MFFCVDVKPLWEKLTQIKESILRLVKHDNEGIRTIAYKFVEVVVVVHAYHTRESDVSAGQEDIGLDVVPLSHPFLNVSTHTHTHTHKHI